MTKHNLNSLIAIIAFAFLLGYANPSVAVSLAPAIFEEYVGLSYYGVFGANNSIAESVNLSVTNEQTGNRGSGTGFATASGVYPVVSEGGLNISGGSNLSGMGGTASVWTGYQFAVVPLIPGLPTTVPIILSTSGFVSVDASLPEWPLVTSGMTYAVIDYPGGQFAARNYDAWGCYEGYFSFNESVTFNIEANTAQTISISLLSISQGSGEGFYYNSYMYLDPLIVIDPSFQYWDQYRLVFSEGINPIPEPATMLLLGSGLIGLAGLRKKFRARS